MSPHGPLKSTGRMYVLNHVYVCMYTCMYVYIYIYIYIYIYKYIHMCVCVCVCVYNTFCTVCVRVVCVFV